MTLRPRTVRPRPASSRSAEASPPPRCTWKPGHLLAVVVHDQLPLEADVGGLDARARVRAAVDVQADRVRQVEAGERALERRARRPSRSPWSRRSRACRTRCRCRRSCRGGMRLGRADRPSSSSPVMSDSTRSSGMSRTHELLVRRRAQARGAVRLDEVGERRERRARDPADDRRDADVEPAVLLAVHADVVAVRERLGSRRGRRAAVRSRYSVSSTSRNFSGPQSASRNFSRALLRRRR